MRLGLSHHLGGATLQHLVGVGIISPDLRPEKTAGFSRLQEINGHAPFGEAFTCVCSGAYGNLDQARAVNVALIILQLTASGSLSYF